MIYKPKIKINGVEIEMGGGENTSPFLSCAELSDVVSKSGLEIGAAAASCLKATITNPHKSSFDGDKVELYISEIDDGETTTKEALEAEVGDSATTELIDTSEEIYTDEPDEEVGEPLTDDEIAEVDTYSSELENLQVKFLEGEPMEIVDIETAEEEDPEWELLGTFWARSQTSSADAVILTCYDNISRLTMQYTQAEKAQTFAEHWAAIKSELAEYDIPLDDFENSDTTPLQFLPLTTMRDALSLLAGYVGGFLACAPDGSLGISFYGYAGEILIRDDLLSISDTSSGEIIVDAIECEGTHGEIITAGGGGQAIRMSNYLVSQDVLNSVIVPLYRGTRYTGGALSCPWSRELVAGEFVRVMTADEYRNYLMLLNSAEDTRALRSSLGQVLIISSQTITFGGTATTVIYSACDSETAKSQYTQTPLKKQIIQADKKAEDAAHTATDFLLPQTSETTDDGLIVCPKAEAAAPQNYAQINQKGMQIYEGGRRAASFGAEKICLGEQSENAVIEMCGGSGKIEGEAFDDTISGRKTYRIKLRPEQFKNDSYGGYSASVESDAEQGEELARARNNALAVSDGSHASAEVWASKAHRGTDGNDINRNAGVTAVTNDDRADVTIGAYDYRDTPESEISSFRNYYNSMTFSANDGEGIDVDLQEGAPWTVRDIGLYNIDEYDVEILWRYQITKGGCVWNVEKYRDGALKLHGRYTNSALTFSGTWGAMYTGKINDRLEYPVQFVEPPREVVQVHGKEVSMFWYPNSSGYGVPTETHSASYIAARPTAAGSTYTVYLDIFAEGKWK